MEVLQNMIKLIACISLVIGAVECFAGFKVMKVMLAIWGFLIGAALGVVIGVVSENTIVGVALVIVLGIVLAVLSYKLYLAGVFILTASLTTVAVYIMSEKIIIALIIAVIVGILAVYFVKPVVIIITAISGAGIIVSSAYTMISMNMNRSTLVTLVLWIPIALAGMFVQFITTQKSKVDKASNTSLGFPGTSSERKYPGMQKAYRNFCIKCGCVLSEDKNKCTRCGYDYVD